MKIASFLIVLATAVPAFAVDGTRVELRAVPEFVNRVFVPVIAGRTNSFAIETQSIGEVLETPKGFTIVRSGGALRITSKSSAAGGYARVRAGKRELQLTLMNLVPYESMRNGTLDGYRVGTYQNVALRGLATYERPKGFIRLTAKNSSLWVSDHYRLRDFQCKLDGSTKFLILRTEALLKLELLQHDLGVGRFTIMSGYRTPYYNSRIGNETSYSRHLYGDAMDIYLDSDRDGRMDDMNRDGRVDAGDARFLLRAAERIDNSSKWGWLKGGAGVYHANTAHGPYLHIDARGYVARWGAVEPVGVLGGSQ